MLFFRLAYRNLRRNRRRTRLTVLSMTTATALVIFILCMYDGMLWDMIANATEMIQGHVTVAAEGFLDNPQVYRSLSGKEWREKILSRPGVRGVCGRIGCFGLLSSGSEGDGFTQPAEILGVHPGEEAGVSRLPRSLIAGTFLSRDDARGILLGSGLARKLNVRPGAEIVFMGQAADGSTAAEIFILEGIIDTGDSLRDGRLAIVVRATLQEALVLPDRIHQWNVFLREPLDAERVAVAWKGQFPGADVRPWQEFIPQIAAILRVWLGVQLVTMMIFYSAVILIGFNTMFMAFRERVREFAVISALGLSRGRLSLLIVLEGGIMSGLSGVAGAAFGFLLSVFFSYFPMGLGAQDISYGGTTLTPRIYCVVSAFNIGLPALCMFLIGVGVSLFPAWKVLRLRPVEALREG